MDATAAPPARPRSLPESGWARAAPSHAWLAALLLAAFAAVFVQNAWVSDDAMITFRSVEQLFAGHGPRWNPHERVQAFTHPLWFLLLAATRLFTRDLIVGATALGFAAAAAALVVAARTLERPALWILGLAAFISSRALVDYSSAGLETTLVYFLLAVLFALALGPGAPVVRVWLAVSALLLCRLDLAPLAVPIALGATLRSPPTASRPWRALLGLLPLALWTGFSLAYYGFPLPNTAYAKLLTGIGAAELATQGGRYLLHAARWDPITLLLIAGGLAVKTPLGRWLRWGIALDLLYVVWVGGDFMAGRFLAPLAWLGLLAGASALPRLSWRLVAPALLALGVYNLAAPSPPLRTTPASGAAWSYQDWWGIADERGHYFSRYGLVPYLRDGRRVPAPRGEHVVIDPQIGIRFSIGHGGWTSPLGRILVDPHGLADPLLARLPCRPGWRVGHYLRGIPDGYLESLKSGRNQIADPALRRYYQDLRRATQGELWTAARWRAIVRLNLDPAAPVPK